MDGGGGGVERGGCAGGGWVQERLRVGLGARIQGSGVRGWEGVPLLGGERGAAQDRSVIFDKSKTTLQGIGASIWSSKGARSFMVPGWGSRAGAREAGLSRMVQILSRCAFAQTAPSFSKRSFSSSDCEGWWK